jgi:peptide/nickel transport system substrate-binding protein
MDFVRGGALSEQLVKLNATTGAPELVLAESIEPNAAATEWTIRVKPGITFHNGNKLTAKDVLYSLQRIKKNNFPGTVPLGPIDLESAVVLDDRTLRVPFSTPYGILTEAIAGLFATRIVPVDFDPTKPVGTGPFKFESFTPGQQSTFSRFDGYWQHGQPYLDKLVIMNFDDETSQTNALQAGQVDLVDLLSSSSVAAVQSGGGKVVVSKTRGFVPLTMRVDTAPFSDVRVRQALRLLVNREQLNQQVFGGLGAIGNDTFGALDAAYKGAIPQRHQDLDKAKSLLRAAGHSDLQLELFSSPIAGGATSVASVFATQAAQAGVKVNIHTQDPTTFFSQSYTQVPFALSFWDASSYLSMAQQGMATGAPFNEIHQTDTSWQALYDKAITTVDAKSRGDVVRELLTFDYDKGGYIIPVYSPNIEGMSSRVNGVSENLTGIPVNGGSGWQNIWLEG